MAEIYNQLMKELRALSVSVYAWSYRAFHNVLRDYKHL